MVVVKVEELGQAVDWGSPSADVGGAALR